MKQDRLSTKRRPVRKGGVSTLFAKVSGNNRRKRHRAATTAEAFEGDVPNLGVARALAVILAIHVVAIGGIFIHSRWFDDGEEAPVVRKAVQVEPTRDAIGGGLRDEREDLVQFRSGDSQYTIGTGDTYARIADRFGVVEEDLRKANDNIPLREGRYLRIPPKTIAAVEPAEFAELRAGRQLSEPITPPVAPAIEPDEPMPAPPRAIPVQPELIATDAARAVDARNAGSPPAAAEPAPSARAGGDRYTVKSGDTFWAIARKHGVDVNQLMKTNGISDPRKLKIGMELRIP